ncbi:thiamine-phosphate diphosphorylase [Chromohalobacter canadensis]|uniref:Thiamine-phosphate synthase n=1 Tax=Chromohalobacter canadensis TaxID=141389 RepID=A0A285VB72_9GAMM|nr:thiamine phosphate synthase [Chromohalobacter canadensis]SOC51339.1 thiamine-phosphate diphosphorylase [Chromohalobacter canadensis]
MTGDWTRGIYAITDATLLPDDERLFAACERALSAGPALLQYRDKSTDADKRWRQAVTLAGYCHDTGVPLIVNDDIALAVRLGARFGSTIGVHLGQQDGALDAAREALGPSAIIGATCHARLDLAERAVAEGASYLAFGRFFTSRTKPEAPPAPLTLLGEAARFGLPRVAIGGLDVHTMRLAHEAGADLLATVHAVFGADDPAVAVRGLQASLGDAARH